MEFKFTSVTPNSLPYYLKCLKELEDDKYWRFCSLMIDLDDKKFNPPKDYLEAWECYLRYIKLMLKRNITADETTTLIADYLRQPKKAPSHSIATLPAIIPQLWDVLQVESQGVLLVQMADVLLGGSFYRGADKVKMKLSEEIKKLRTKTGRSRFNEWKVKWS